MGDDLRAMIGSSNHLAEQVSGLAEAFRGQLDVQQKISQQMQLIVDGLRERENRSGREPGAGSRELLTPHNSQPAEGYSFLTEEMIGGIQKIFDVFDRDQSGDLSQTETIQLVERLGLGSRQDGIKLVAEIDANNDGVISCEELIAFMDSTKCSEENNHKLDHKLDFGGIATTKTGFGGTTWRNHANIAWLSCSCLLIIAAAVLIVGFVYFTYILVPLMMGWFLTFLIGPIVDVLEQRPLVCGHGHYVCQAKPGPRRFCLSVERPPEDESCAAALSDFFCTAKLP